MLVHVKFRVYAGALSGPQYDWAVTAPSDDHEEVKTAIRKDSRFHIIIVKEDGEIVIDELKKFGK
ncbi:MAG: hypothetical protein Q7S66_04200 [bacterium]|nr:hypothetical protein [bacterium]